MRKSAKTADIDATFVACVRDRDTVTMAVSSIDQFDEVIFDDLVFDDQFPIIWS